MASPGCHWKYSFASSLPPEQQVIKQDLTEEEKQTKKSRTTLKTSITVLAVASAALFCYIIYCVIDLL